MPGKRVTDHQVIKYKQYRQRLSVGVRRTHLEALAADVKDRVHVISQVDTMAGEDGRRRQRYSAETKARIVAECAAAGASVARVAMSHGINANVVHRWRQRARERSPAAQGPVSTAMAGFIPVSVAEAAALSRDGGDIRIELRRGATAMTICWPVAAAGSCAAWLRELWG